MNEKKKRFVIAALVVVVGGVLAYAGWIAWWSVRQDSVVREYKTQGLQMVEGCNLGAANVANGQVYAIKQRLEEIAASRKQNTNMIAELQNALVIAQEKHSILSRDCRQRGHRENHPWNTNWAAIKHALTASEWTYW